MQVDCALLCDAATVREGLLHVLGGGITRANRPSFPSPVDLTLALRILVHPTEADRVHNLTVKLQNGDGAPVAEFQIDFGIDENMQIDAGEHASLAIPLRVPPMALLPEPGVYSFELLIDGIHQYSVPFRAELIPQVEGEDDGGEQLEPGGEPEDN